MGRFSLEVFVWNRRPGSVRRPQPLTTVHPANEQLRRGGILVEIAPSKPFKLHRERHLVEGSLEAAYVQGAQFFSSAGFSRPAGLYRRFPIGLPATMLDARSARTAPYSDSALRILMASLTPLSCRGAKTVMNQLLPFVFRSLVLLT
jgi:hypothetical protein